MKMNRNEMEALYAFGCPNLKATVERLRILSWWSSLKRGFSPLSVRLQRKKLSMQ